MIKVFLKIQSGKSNHPGETLNTCRVQTLAGHVFENSGLFFIQDTIHIFPET